jgi:hypothetical protein
MKKILIGACLLISISACKKDEVVNATISITSPTATDTLAFGDTLALTGTVNGTGEMHGYSVNILNVLSGVTVYSHIYDIHATSYAVSDSWVNEVVDTSIVQATIDVIKDHDGNHELKSVSVVCLPQ